MSIYSDEVNRLNKLLYPHDDLTKQIMQAKHFIDKHFSGDIDLEKIAATAHISKFHFIRIFKKYYGLTPNQYLQHVRIENAKRLLKKGNSIDEVCMAIGFASKTSFIGLFKKATAHTPIAYRKRKAILKSK